MKNRAWKAIPFWDLFRDGFWMGFLWKIRVFRKTAKARIRYKNSGFSVFIDFASKTALGPLQDHFRTPNRATFWSRNLLLTFLGRFRRGPKNGPRFLTYFMLIFRDFGPPVWDPKSSRRRPRRPKSSRSPRPRATWRPKRRPELAQSKGEGRSGCFSGRF